LSRVCVAVCCSVLQCVAVCCSVVSTLSRATNYILQHTVTHCNTLQHTASHCNTQVQQRCLFGAERPMWNTIRDNVSGALHVCCSVLQRVAACCSVLQRVAACCSVLQRVTILAVCLLRQSDPYGTPSVTMCQLPFMCDAACFSVWQYVAVCHFGAKRRMSNAIRENVAGALHMRGSVW